MEQNIAWNKEEKESISVRLFIEKNNLIMKMLVFVIPHRGDRTDHFIIMICLLISVLLF